MCVRFLSLLLLLLPLPLLLLTAVASTVALPPMPLLQARDVPSQTDLCCTDNSHGWSGPPELHQDPRSRENLQVKTLEKTLFFHQGDHVTLPCSYHYRRAPAPPWPVLVKWWKLSEKGAPEKHILVASRLRYRSFGNYQGRVRLRQSSQWDVSLEIRDLRLKDRGRYRCEIVDRQENQSVLLELELQGVVFPYQPHQSRYHLTFAEAQRTCRKQGAAMASVKELFRAWEEGLDWCNAGWVRNTLVQYPIVRLQQPRGGLGLAPGVRRYGLLPLHRSSVFCFAAALKGRVYYLEHPAKLTLAEAREACREDDAQIAKVGQLFAAWSFQGLDCCNAGWLADGSVRYPVTYPHPNCRSVEPGIQSFGIPVPQSRGYGVYCYRPR